MKKSQTKELERLNKLRAGLLAMIAWLDKKIAKVKTS